MRLLITGAGGLLGLNLALRSLRTHTVIGVDRGTLHDAPFELLRMDLSERNAFVRALSTSRADAVVHCAAIADVDACERDPDAAWRVNTALSASVAQACHRSSVPMIHISTDAVFDGTGCTPYSESDLPNPTSVYARTKLEAEGEVLAAHRHAIVARVNFYGWSPTGTRSLAEYFVNGLSTGAAVKGFADVIFCPMLVTDLAAVLLRMLESELTGLYHAVGPESMSKYAFGLAIAKAFDLDSALLNRDSVEAAGLVAPRAHYLALSVHKLSTALGESLPGFSTGLLQFRQQHSEGYPQLLRSYQQLSTAADPGSAGWGAVSGAGPE